jgi:hypothetical protein
MKTVINRNNIVIFSIISIIVVLIIKLWPNKNQPDCKGLLCDYYDQIAKDFEPTEVDKDQGYIFLKTHAEQDTTTSRIIIRSMDGIFYAYKSNDGWYAQGNGEFAKFTLNELGHALAEKENLYDKKINLLWDKKLKLEIETLKRQVSSYSLNVKFNSNKIDTAIFNSLKIDTAFLYEELNKLKRGETSFWEFMEFAEKQELKESFTDKLRKVPRIGFYNQQNNFFPLAEREYYIGNYELPERFEYNPARIEYLIKSGKIITSLANIGDYYTGPFIYVSSEGRWYGPDNFNSVVIKNKIK